METPKKKRRFGFGCAVLLLISLLFLGWCVSPVIKLYRDQSLLKQPAYYEAVLEAGIEFLNDMRARGEETFAADFDDAEDVRHAVRLNAISEALNPVVIHYAGATCLEDREVLTLMCGKLFLYRCGYRIYKNHKDESIAIEFWERDGLNIELKKCRPKI